MSRTSDWNAPATCAGSRPETPLVGLRHDCATLGFHRIQHAERRPSHKRAKYRRAPRFHMPGSRLPTPSTPHGCCELAGRADTPASQLAEGDRPSARGRNPSPVLHALLAPRLLRPRNMFPGPRPATCRDFGSSEGLLHGHANGARFRLFLFVGVVFALIRSGRPARISSCRTLQWRRRSCFNRMRTRL